MNLGDAYSIVILLHLVADLLFVGGLLLSALMLTALSFQGAAEVGGEARLVGFLRRWNRFVTSPALVLAWLLGAWLAHTAGWFGAHWLMAKLVLVIALSGLYGVLSAALRRASATPPAVPSRAWRTTAPIAILAVAAIVWLVLLKPF
jgi:putative membrane protein